MKKLTHIKKYRNICKTILKLTKICSNINLYMEQMPNEYICMKAFLERMEG
jgi:hypothetical protein